MAEFAAPTLDDCNEGVHLKLGAKVCSFAAYTC